MLNIFRKIFSSANQRRIAEYEKVVKKINEIEEDIANFNEEDFKNISLNNDENEDLIKIFA